jgi:hypothetical protein
VLDVYSGNTKGLGGIPGLLSSLGFPILELETRPFGGDEQYHILDHDHYFDVFIIFLTSIY